ncbi:hypothetical protein EB796_017484 [Bugula neritina]|uniref:Uncharacterized protein n=1 Tax=Bugula neritina TaxID=10212 RepID=A0A7J7JF38_BUGNE|nr:hypothetical protein EB796_017484 [Bugula neritina]
MLVSKFLIRLISVGTAIIVPTVRNILLIAVLLYNVICFHCYVDFMTFFSTQSLGKIGTVFQFSCGLTIVLLSDGFANLY